MFKFIVDWFGKKPDPKAEAPAVVVAPYKVETPVQAAPVSTPAPVAVASAPVASAPAKKAPAKKRQFDKKPVAAIKTPAKPRAPRKPRAK